MHNQQRQSTLHEYQMMDHVIYRCVIGSRAYGLETEDSDTDRRGVYLPTAELHWSLFGVPEQIEIAETQDCYWELQKFLTMALKANPNILECLYSPLIEYATPLANELLAMREKFLSKLTYPIYSGYAESQFKKLQADLRNRDDVKWKHVMHLIRLLISGITVLRDGYVPVRIDTHREALLSVRRGELPLEEIEKWRLQLNRELDEAFEKTKLPDRPDYAAINAFLLKARRSAM